MINLKYDVKYLNWYQKVKGRVPAWRRVACAGIVRKIPVSRWYVVEIK